MSDKSHIKELWGEGPVNQKILDQQPDTGSIDYLLGYNAASRMQAIREHFSTLEEALRVEQLAHLGDELALVRLHNAYSHYVPGYRQGQGRAWMSVTPSSGAWEFKAIMIGADYDAVLSVKKALADYRGTKYVNNEKFLEVPLADSINYGDRNSALLHGYRRFGSQFPKHSPRYLIDDYLYYHTPNATLGAPIWSKEYSKQVYINYSKDQENPTPAVALTNIKRENATLISLLSTCALAGDAIAAIELSTLFGVLEGRYRFTRALRFDKKLPNPTYDLDKAREWDRIADFLSGEIKDESQIQQVLGQFILSQDKTPGGLYNIGHALYTNPHVRAANNRRLGRSPDDMQAAIDTLKHAINLGDANAARFYGETFHLQFNKNDDANALNMAHYYYTIAADLGNPNAAARKAFFKKAYPELLNSKFSSFEFTNPTSEYLQYNPGSVGNINVPDIDYSFVNNSAVAVTDRLRKGAEAADLQTAGFEEAISQVQAKVAYLIAAAERKQGTSQQREQDIRNALRNNTKLDKDIWRQRFMAELADDQLADQAMESAAQIVLYSVLPQSTQLSPLLLSQAIIRGAKAGIAKLSDNGEEVSDDSRTAALVALLEAQKIDIGPIEAEIKEIASDIKRLSQMQSIQEFRADNMRTGRLADAYLRRQVLHLGLNNCEALEYYLERSGMSSLDQFLGAIDHDASRALSASTPSGSNVVTLASTLMHTSKDMKALAAVAIRKFCFGRANSDDLHIMLQYSDSLPQNNLPAHLAVLKSFVEGHVKPSIDDYIPKSSRNDVLEEAQFDLVLGSMAKLAEAPPGLVALQSNGFATGGSADIDRAFAFFMHRHGGRVLHPTRVNEGLATDATEPKKVTVMKEDELGDYNERVTHAYRAGRKDLPSVNSLFLRVCASDYFEASSVAISGPQANFRESPQAPVAIPLINEVINNFIERMSLSPIGQYHQAMDDRSLLNNLFAQTFIDFFATLGRLHAHDGKLQSEFQALANAFNTGNYGARYNLCKERITDDALRPERYELFTDLFQYNLNRSLEVMRQGDGGQLLKQLEALQAEGKAAFQDLQVLVPGTPEAVEVLLSKSRKYENANPSPMRVASSR